MRLPISVGLRVVLLPLLLGSTLRQLALPREQGWRLSSWSGDCNYAIEDWRLHYSRLLTLLALP